MCIMKWNQEQKIVWLAEHIGELIGEKQGETYGRKTGWFEDDDGLYESQEGAFVKEAPQAGSGNQVWSHSLQPSQEHGLWFPC